MSSKKPRKNSKSDSKKSASTPAPTPVEKPDADAYKAKLADLEEKLKALKDQQKDIQEQIDERLDEKQKFSTSKSKFMRQRKHAIQSRRNVFDDLELLQEQVRDRERARIDTQLQLRRMRKRLKYTSLEKLDTAVQEIEKNLSFYNPTEQQRYKAEVVALKQQRPLVQKYQQAKSAWDNEETKQKGASKVEDEISQKEKARRGALSGIKKSMSEADNELRNLEKRARSFDKDLSKFRAQVGIIKTDIYKITSKIRNVTVKYQALDRQYHTQQEFEKKKIVHERAAAIASQAKMTRQAVPFRPRATFNPNRELNQNLNILESYLRRLLPKTEEAKEGEEGPSAVLSLRSERNSAFKGQTFAVMTKKKEEFFQVRQKPERKRKQKKKKQKQKPLVIDRETMSLFSTVRVNPPFLISEIPTVLEKLAAKRKELAKPPRGDVTDESDEDYTDEADEEVSDEYSEAEEAPDEKPALAKKPVTEEKEEKPGSSDEETAPAKETVQEEEKPEESSDEDSDEESDEDSDEDDDDAEVAQKAAVSTHTVSTRRRASMEIITPAAAEEMKQLNERVAAEASARQASNKESEDNRKKASQQAVALETAEQLSRVQTQAAERTAARSESSKNRQESLTAAKKAADEEQKRRLTEKASDDARFEAAEKADRNRSRRKSIEMSEAARAEAVVSLAQKEDAPEKIKEMYKQAKEEGEVSESDEDSDESSSDESDESSSDESDESSSDEEDDESDDDDQDSVQTAAPEKNDSPAAAPAVAPTAEEASDESDEESDESDESDDSPAEF